MTMRWLLCGLLMLSACTTIPVKEATAPPVVTAPAHPLGFTLPPDAPQLYDNEVYSRFHRVAQRPYQVHGVKLAPWLLSHVLDEAVWGNAMGREATEPVLLVHRVGYVTDNRNQAYGRILALVETLIDPVTQYRMIRFSLDNGWVKSGEANGDWSAMRTTAAPIRRDEAILMLEPIHMLVAIGYLHYAKAHSLPVPKIPVVPVTTERHRHAGGEVRGGTHENQERSEAMATPLPRTLEDAV